MLSEIVLLEEAEAKAKAELDMLRKFHAAATASGVVLRATHNYECRRGRLKCCKPCSCGGDERQARIDRALAVLAEAAEDAIDG